MTATCSSILSGENCGCFRSSVRREPRASRRWVVASRSEPNCAKAAISRYCASSPLILPATFFIALVCADAEFIRRAFVDTIGLLPTAEETRSFLADKSKNKRDKLIESLLRRPEFVDYWTYKWSDLLLVSTKQLKPPAVWSYYNWIRNNVAANTPWDVFARKVVTAQGSTLENGAANFYVLHDDPRAMSETASQAFLGM